MRNSINERTVKDLSERIKAQFKEFDSVGFNLSINPKLETLGLFERLDLITLNLYKFLPEDFETAAKILIGSLGDEIDPEKADLDGVDLSSENGFIVVALTNFIANYGINYFDTSMGALYEMTKRFSSEGAIRKFIIAYPEKCFAIFREWALDENVHVRRLVSECLRPRLPWAIRLQQFISDPEPIIEFLNVLKNDKELYVRRSVANNLNDIAKDHPDIVVKVLEKWSKDRSKNMNWLVRHALRTLVKNGNPGALEILGYKQNPKIKAINMDITRSIKLGDNLQFSFDIESCSNESQKLVIDYIVFHMKANGSLAPKVFKLKNVTIEGNEKLTVNKIHGIKKITTRKYYSGTHKVVIQINGKEFLNEEFFLSV